MFIEFQCTTVSAQQIPCEYDLIEQIPFAFVHQSSVSFFKVSHQGLYKSVGPTSAGLRLAPSATAILYPSGRHSYPP